MPDAQSVHGAGTEIFNENVTVLDELQQNLFAFLRFQIDGNTLLVAVEIGKKSGTEPFEPPGAIAFSRAFDFVNIAPISARTRPQVGPMTAWPSSSTLMPSNGRFSFVFIIN